MPQTHIASSVPTAARDPRAPTRVVFATTGPRERSPALPFDRLPRQPGARPALRPRQAILRMKLATRFAATLLGASLCTSAPAQSAWEVHDKHANDHLAEIEKRIGNDGNVNANLNKLAKIGNAKKSGDDAKEPEEKLDAKDPSVQVKKSMDERCPNPGGSAGAAQQQWQLCQEIVKTELAQYTYSMTMYELSRKRQERLQEIEQERGNLSVGEQGKLQDNSNKLLALLSRMEVDRQQSRAYMDAYTARLTYLRAVRDMLSNEILSGKESGGGGAGGGGNLMPKKIVAAVAGMAAMKTALKAAESKRLCSPWIPLQDGENCTPRP